jgi:ssDNA-binding replication factor A large subunit
MTSVSVADQAEYSFQYTERAETITDVKTILENEDAYNMVNIHGKVVQLTPEEKVGKQQYKLRNGAFVDSTGVIKLQIWQENIAEIEEGKVYTVTSVRVGIWNGEKTWELQSHR